jgi:hypothetical protein
MTLPVTLPVTLLGPDIDHRLSLESMLGGRSAVSWVPDSSTFFKTHGAKWWPNGARRLERVLGTRNPAYLAALRGQFQAHRTRTVVAYWGTEPLPDLLAIKRIRPDIKLILMVLCYPVSLTAPGIVRQNWMMKRAARVLDGVLFPNEAMRQYFLDQGLMAPDLPSLILPPCWPAAFQAQGEQPLGLDEPSVIFTGRTDLSSGTIHAADDLRPLMAEIMASGTVLHHAASPETRNGHPMRRPFQPMSQTDLIAAMPRHDASLIAYNTAACERDDRFLLTVPDRLITSVAAGVPVAVPRSGYHGLKQYLVDYPALIEFDDPVDLHRQLQDRPRIRHLHNQAWAARSHYAAERHAAALSDFIGRITA